MKRMILIAVLLILSISVCFASSTENYLYDHSAGSLPIYGHMDSYWVISVERITHGGGNVGMDFDLLGDDIVYNSDSSLGRLIAYWTFIVNLTSGWRLKIYASPLTLKGVSGGSEINYHLTFNLDYPDDNGNDVSTDWRVNSSEAGGYVIFPSVEYSHKEVASVAKQIRFMLDDYTLEQKYAWDEGQYSSTVSLILESE